MKALEILNRLKQSPAWLPKFEDLKEAIKELEQLCDSKYLHKCIDERIAKLEELNGSNPSGDNHTCEGCKYGKFGVDSIGIEVECMINRDCTRGRKDRWESKE